MQVGDRVMVFSCDREFGGWIGNLYRVVPDVSDAYAVNFPVGIYRFAKGEIAHLPYPQGSQRKEISQS